MSELSFGLFCTIFSITIGSGFHHGYHSGFTNILQEDITAWIKQIEIQRNNGSLPLDHSFASEWSLFVIGFPLGGVVGGALTQFCATKHSPKVYLMWNNILILIGTLILMISKPSGCYELLTLGRFVFGINVGLNCGLAVIYLMEIAPVQIRGAVGSCYQLMLSVGVLTSQIFGLLFSCEDHWPYVFLIPLVPALVQMITLPFCPESPIYLFCVKEDENKAIESLQKLRGKKNIKKELDEIILFDSFNKELRPLTIKRFYSDSHLMMLLFVCAAVMAGRQFCGISLLVYNSVETFDHVGLSMTEAIYFTLGLSVTKILLTVVSLYIVDYYGRRKMLLFGFCGIALDTLALMLTLLVAEANSVCKFIIALFYFPYMLFYAPGIGTISFFLTAEMFHPPSSFLVMSFVIPINCIANIVTVETFLPLISAIGYYVCVVFMILDVFTFLCVYLYLPETNKKPKTEIIKLYS